MNDEPVAILGPLKDWVVHGDLETGQVIVGLSTAIQATAATVTAEQLQTFIAEALVVAGQSTPDRPNTTHTGEISGRSIRVGQLGLAAGTQEGSVVIAFPVGRVTMSFELPLALVVKALSRYLATGVQGPAPPKTN